MRTERELGSNIHRTMAERAPVWRKQVTSAESEIADRIATVLETAKQAEAKRQEVCLLDLCLAKRTTDVVLATPGKRQ